MTAGSPARSLGELCAVIGGGTPPKSNPGYYNGTIPWATVRDMQQDTLAATEHRITREAVASSSTNVIPSGNVVIATRVGLGKVCILGQDTAINQDLRGIVPLSESVLNVRYLFWWLKSMSGVIVAEGTGATVQGVKLPFIKSLKIPLPTLAEQQRIVRLLDEAFEGIAIAKANAEKNLQNARALFQSHLQAVFAGSGVGWETKKVGAISTHSLGKMLDKQKNKGALMPYLRNFNVRWFDFDLSSVLEMRFLPTEIERYTVLKGDVLVCEGGYPGRAAIWESSEPIYFQKALHRVRFSEAKRNRWFVYYLIAKDADGTLKNHFNGTGIQHLTSEALSRMEVPLPPLAEQDILLKKLDEVQEHVRLLTGIYSEKMLALADLKSALLSNAFSGDLMAA